MLLVASLLGARSETKPRKRLRYPNAMGTISCLTNASTSRSYSIQHSQPKRPNDKPLCERLLAAIGGCLDRLHHLDCLFRRGGVPKRYVWRQSGQADEGQVQQVGCYEGGKGEEEVAADHQPEIAAVFRRSERVRRPSKRSERAVRTKMRSFL